MAYDFSTRLDTLGTRMKELHQNSLIYKRVDNTDITVSNFTPERIDLVQAATAGVTQLVDKLQDFVFDTADLSGLSPSLPQEDDKIVWDSKTFKPISLNEELYSFTTTSRKRIRVHTIQVV